MSITTKILSVSEVRAVIAALKAKRRYVNNRQAVVIFRLACCCGLRASEICGITVDDVRTEGSKPHIRIRKGIGKGGRVRRIPLWWDGETLTDLRAWRAEQVERGATHFVSAQSVDANHNRLDRRTVRRIFNRVCRVLPGREDATAHDGRHTFCSLSLAGGRSLTEVRDAAGHASVHTTSLYLHVAGDDGKVGALFAG